MFTGIIITVLSYLGIIEQPPFRFNGRNIENTYCYIYVKEISSPFAQFNDTDGETKGDKAYIVKNEKNESFVIVSSDKAFVKYSLDKLTGNPVKLKGISEKLTDEFLTVSDKAFQRLGIDNFDSKVYLSVENKSFDVVRILGISGFFAGAVLFIKKLYDFLRIKALKKQIEYPLTKPSGDFEKIQDKILLFEDFIAFEKMGSILYLEKEKIYWIYSKNIYRRFAPKEIIKKRIIRVILKDGTSFNIYEVYGKKSFKQIFENTEKKLYEALPFSLKGFTLKNLKAAKNIVFSNKKTHL